MSHIPLLRPDKAPPEANQVYDDFHRRISFPRPPNFIMTQGHAPTDVPVSARDKTTGADLARLNETRRVTGGDLVSLHRGQPDANINTPRRGPTVER